MTDKIDHRINYHLVLDTETANTLDDPLMYDIGGAVVDKRGKVYATFSFVIDEIFNGMKDLMQSAYFAEKIPMYVDEIAKGERQVVSLNYARKYIAELCEKYNIKDCIAHNAPFDYRATSKTQRYLTKSKYRWFLPFGIEIWDTMRMAESTICKSWTYKEWCYKNGYLTKNGRVRKTAEILYRYITGDDDFVESHTALEDVLIEKEIFAHCMRQHKPMRKLAFNPR